MNVNVRETGGHIEFEPSSYYSAFSCELEAAAYPMWSVLAHLSAPAHAPLARRLVHAALAFLRDWLDAVDFTPERLRRVSHCFPTVPMTESLSVSPFASPITLFVALSLHIHQFISQVKRLRNKFYFKKSVIRC